ncbi:MAG: hypothetical protein K0B37_18305 [Bacteroidales bacterium]|nr:hypothetical protein [Bacteroidales bacterium]
MNNPEVKKLIRKYDYLFWYTPEQEKENISLDMLVENILNYGDMDAIKNLFETLGLQKTAEIFFNATGRKKGNYFPEIHNLFTLYFKKHV